MKIPWILLLLLPNSRLTKVLNVAPVDLPQDRGQEL